MVAMSGGVDSSVAAALLKEQGHEVLGISLRVWSYESQAQCGSCCSPDDIDDARRVAERLDIPFYVANVEELFKERVVSPFVQSYLGGETPIPCLACNQDVKFGFLLHRAAQLDAALATGHYARIDEAGGRRRLLKAVDAAKDQTYFLFTLGQPELERLVFPVGGMTKPEVRAAAERFGLVTTNKPESMEICFVPDGDYAGFVEKVAGPQPGGDIVSTSGEVLGHHDGIHRYTIGQRKGLNLAAGHPLYVLQIDSASRQVVVGPANETRRGDFTLRRPHWVDGEVPLGRPVQVRVRHRHQGAGASITATDDGQLHVTFDEPVRAVTPGQAAVVYDGDVVLGGGWIG